MSLLQPQLGNQPQTPTEPQRSSVVGGFTWVSIERGIRLIVGVCMSAWIGRHLGPNNFGQLQVALAWVGIVGVFANLGLDTILHREFATAKDSAAIEFSAALYLRLAGSLVATCAFTVIALATTDSELRLVYWGVAFINLQPVAAINELWLQSHGWNGPAARTQLLTLLGATLWRLLLLLQDCSVVAFAWAFAFESVLGLLLFTATGRRLGMVRGWRTFPRTKILQLLRQCLPMLGAVLGAALYQKIDVVLVAHFCASETVGNYGAAVRLSEPTYVIPLVFAAVVAPRLARLKQKTDKSYEHLFSNYLAVSVGSGIFVAGSTTVLAPLVIPLLFGDEFTSAIDLLRIRTWVVPFLCCEICRSIHLVQLGFTKLVLGAQLVGTTTIFVVGPILTGLYGAPGAATSAILAMAAAGWASCWLHPATFEIGRKFVLLAIRPDLWVKAAIALFRDKSHLPVVQCKF